MRRHRWLWLSLVLLLLFAAGCSSPPAPTPTGDTAVALPTRPPVTVPPTFTPDSRAPELIPTQPQVTVTQPTLTPTATDIPYGDTVIQLRLRIPALGLDRRLQGSISSQIILVDEATGAAVQRNNQAVVLLDLQGVLPKLQLDPVPEGCDTCVLFSYDLELENVSRQGWLQDPVLLASLENYFTINLGPHYPPDTFVALRRSASPFAPAHTVAATRDGLLYTWLASQAAVPPAQTTPPALVTAFNELAGVSLAPQYRVGCQGSAPETLYIASEDNEWRINLECPEYALPRKLQSLYLQLDSPLRETLADSGSSLSRPPARLPIGGVIAYERLDGAELLVMADNSVMALTPANEVFTGTISTDTQITLLTDLLNSGELRTGLTSFDVVPTPTGTVVATFTPVPRRSRLLVRGLEAVYDGLWSSFNPPALQPLNNLYDQLVFGAPENDDAPEAGAGAPEGTNAPQETAAGTPPPPSATPTP